MKWVKGEKVSATGGLVIWQCKKKASSANGTRGPLADSQVIKCKRDSALKKQRNCAKVGDT